MAKKLKKKNKGLDIGNKFKYKLVNAFWGSVVFILGYIIFISPLPSSPFKAGLQKFIYIWMWNLLGGWIVSMFFRAKYRYFDADFDFQFMLKHMIISLFTAIYIFFGISSLVGGYSLYSLSTIGEFLQLFIEKDFYLFILYLFLFKTVISWLADLWADKIAFGG